MHILVRTVFTHDAGDDDDDDDDDDDGRMKMMMWKITLVAVSSRSGKEAAACLENAKDAITRGSWPYY